MTDAITREEKLLAGIADGNGSGIKPITREELFLAKLAGQNVQTPEPITRREKLLQGIIDNGSGGSGDTGGGDIDALIDNSIAEIVSNAAMVGDYKFRDCVNLSKVNLPNASSIGKESFYNTGDGGERQHLITELNIPNVTNIKDRAFYLAYGSVELYAPSLTTLGSDVFRNGNILIKIIAPILTTVPDKTFYGQSKLVMADFSTITSIGTYALFSCQSLTTLVIRKNDSVCTLSATSALQSTKIESGTGYIYVPRALVDSYKSATNWSTYASQFRALEDYTADGTITGELDESKI